MLYNLYLKYFKKKFFNKIFIVYSAISVISIMALALLASNNISMSLIQKEQEYNEQVLNQVDSYLEQRLEISKNMIQQLYINHSYYMEVSYLIKNGYNRFLGYKLDKFSLSDENAYNGFEQYFEATMSNTKDFISISIYSRAREEMYLYSGNLSITTPDVIFDGKGEQLTEVLRDKILPVHNVKYYINKGNSRVYTIVYPILDSFSRDNLGFLAIDIDVSAIENLILKNKKNFKGNVLILTKDGQVLYTSEGTYDSRQVMDFSKLNDSDGSIINTKTYNDPELVIAVITSKKQLSERGSFATKTIFIISLFCITGAIFLALLSMTIFSKRIKLILDAFTKVKNGDLSFRIQLNTQYDEISEMALNFNSMCDELNLYIQKVYVSDIKQKEAELKALQAQINPHFLYNTLEGIRMSALTKGNNEVGNMIYLLSELFRNSIKEKSIISIQEELEYCKMYLDLFSIRHEGKLSVNYNIQEESLSYAIIKRTIQPLIENCIKYAVNTARTDNCITIKVFMVNKDLLIHVIDNGKGLEKERLEEIKRFLNDPDIPKGSGLGLSNINERIKIIFGSEYGIEIDSEYGKGTVLKLKIPALIKKEMEEYVQGVHS
jgi:two-component system, sensor histidine kinase YesM